MKIEFSGGAGCVTGSSHLITASGRKVLLDCGLYQGADAKERGNDSFPFDPAQIDCLVLSHAHIDHSGRIPMLYKKGFRGRIIATPPTIDLCGIMLRDSAFIQEQDAERENRRRARGRKPFEEPLYTIREAEAVLKLFEPLDYGIEEEVFPGLRVRFQDSGHMLGSAFVEIWAKDDAGEDVKIVFSGDIGNHNIPLMREPHYIDEADILIMESTYGDRVHEPQANENERLLEIINSTVKNGGNVIIPSFAVGRTQEILYVLNEFAETGKLDPGVRVFVDSPLASKATQIFKKNRSYFDREAQERLERGDHVLDFDQLYFTESVEDSKKLNATPKGLVIISASGMAEAGRVRHHLKHNLWRPESTICFVGYQAEQTLGRLLIDGIEEVKLFGEEIAVEARIEQLHGLSGHADQKGLIEFAEAFSKRKPKKVFLVHGDHEAQEILAKKLREKDLRVLLPREGTIADIHTAEDLQRPDGTTIVRPEDLVPAGWLKERVVQGIQSLDFENLTNQQILDEVESILSAGGLSGRVTDRQNRE